MQNDVKEGDALAKMYTDESKKKCLERLLMKSSPITDEDYSYPVFTYDISTKGIYADTQGSLKPCKTLLN